MCFRQKTESSLLDGCHNMLQFCPKVVVGIVLPCKKMFSLMCVFHNASHTSYVYTCIELWTSPLLLRSVSLSITTTKKPDGKGKKICSYNRELDTFIVHNKGKQTNLEETVPVLLAISAPWTAPQPAEVTTFFSQ